LVVAGDFVDKGPHSVEVLAVVCALKLSLPSCVHLNRGNHEDTWPLTDFAAEVSAIPLTEKTRRGDSARRAEGVCASINPFASLPR
jgi:hypothetical protein